MRTGSKSGWMTPLEGEAFLTSAMSPGRPVAAAAAFRAPMKSRGGGAPPAAAITAARGRLSRMAATSVAFHHTISSRMLRGADSGSWVVVNCMVPHLLAAGKGERERGEGGVS